jgi:hypothetical protein
MNFPLTIQTASAKAEQLALLNSGATENFIDHKTWRGLGIGKQTLLVPINVLNVDSSENCRGKITDYCWLRVGLGKQDKLQRFFIMSLGKDRMILGYPFLQVFNSNIDWAEGTLREGKVMLQCTCFKWICSLEAKAAKTYAKIGQLAGHTWLFLRKVNFTEKWACNTSKEQTYLLMQGLPPEF